MRKTLLVPMAAALLTTGCSIDLLGPIDFTGLGSGCCSPGISASSNTPNVLTGDTIRFWTFLFPVAGDSTNWSVSDSAFRVVRISPSRDTMVLVATRRGSALVMASRGGATATSSVAAHDSQDVSALRVRFPFSNTSMRQSQRELEADAELRAGNQVIGSHRPAWSTSDTTRAVIAVRAGPSFDPAPRAFIQPRGVGQVYIIASWGTLRDSVNLTITP